MLSAFCDAPRARGWLITELYRFCTVTRRERNNLVSKRWLAPITLALLCGSAQASEAWLSAERAHIRPGAVRARPPGDQHRLRMVRDHAGHECHVGLVVRLAHQVGPGRWIGFLRRRMGDGDEGHRRGQEPVTPGHAW